MAHSLEAALELAANETDVFIIGGAILFKEAFEKNRISYIYETLVHANVEGDVIFVLPNPEKWEIVAEESRKADAKNEYDFTFIEKRVLADKHR